MCECSSTLPKSKFEETIEGFQEFENALKGDNKNPRPIIFFRTQHGEGPSGGFLHDPDSFLSSSVGEIREANEDVIFLKKMMG